MSGYGCFAWCETFQQCHRLCLPIPQPQSVHPRPRIVLVHLCCTPYHFHPRFHCPPCLLSDACAPALEKSVKSHLQAGQAAVGTAEPRSQLLHHHLIHLLSTQHPSTKQNFQSTTSLPCASSKQNGAFVNAWRL